MAKLWHCALVNMAGGSWECFLRLRGEADLHTYIAYFLVDLCWVAALLVRVLHCGQLQHAHPKGVDVHFFIVILVVQLGGHVFGGACRALRCMVHHPNKKLSSRLRDGTLPRTLWGVHSFLMTVARPRSPIFTSPVVPLMNTLSHFRSRWIIIGV